MKIYRKSQSHGGRSKPTLNTNGRSYGTHPERDHHGYSDKSHNKVASTPRSMTRKVHIDAIKKWSSAETDLEFGQHGKSRNGIRKLSPKKFGECFYKSDTDWTKNSFSSRSCYHNRGTDWSRSSYSSRSSHDDSRNCRHRNSSPSSSDNSYQSYYNKKRSSVTDFSSDTDDSRCKRRKTLCENSPSDSFGKHFGQTKIRRPSTNLQLSGSGGEILCDEYERTKLWIKENFQKLSTKDEKQRNRRFDYSSGSLKSEERAKKGESRREKTIEKTKSISSCSVESESGSSICSSSSDSDTTASSRLSLNSFSFSISVKENRSMKRRKPSGRTPQRRRTRSSSCSSTTTLSTSESYFRDSSDERTGKKWKSARKEKIRDWAPPVLHTADVNPNISLIARNKKRFSRGSFARTFSESVSGITPDGRPSNQETAGQTLEQDGERSSVERQQEGRTISPLKCTNIFLEEVAESLYKNNIAKKHPELVLNWPSDTLVSNHSTDKPTSLNKSILNIAVNRTNENYSSLRRPFDCNEFPSENNRDEETNIDAIKGSEESFVVKCPCTVCYSNECLGLCSKVDKPCTYGYNVTWNDFCKTDNVVRYSTSSWLLQPGTPFSASEVSYGNVLAANHSIVLEERPNTETQMCSEVECEQENHRILECDIVEVVQETRANNNDIHEYSNSFETTKYNTGDDVNSKCEPEKIQGYETGSSNLLPKLQNVTIDQDRDQLVEPHKMDGRMGLRASEVATRETELLTMNKSTATVHSLSYFSSLSTSSESVTGENQEAATTFDFLSGNGCRPYSPSSPTSDTSTFVFSATGEDGFHNDCSDLPRSAETNDRSPTRNFDSSSFTNYSDDSQTVLEPNSFKALAHASLEKTDGSKAGQDDLASVYPHSASFTKAINICPTKNVVTLPSPNSLKKKHSSFETSSSTTKKIKLTGEMSNITNDVKNENDPCSSDIREVVDTSSQTLHPSLSDVTSLPEGITQKITHHQRAALYLIKEKMYRSSTKNKNATKIIYFTNDENKDHCCTSAYSELSKVNEGECESFSEPDNDHYVKLPNSIDNSRLAFKVAAIPEVDTNPTSDVNKVQKSGEDGGQIVGYDLDQNLLKSLTTSNQRKESSLMIRFNDEEVMIEVKSCVDELLEAVTQKENAFCEVLPSKESCEGQSNSTNVKPKFKKLSSNSKMMKSNAETDSGINRDMKSNTLPDNGIFEKIPTRKQKKSQVEIIQMAEEVCLVCTNCVQNHALVNDCSDISRRGEILSRVSKDGDVCRSSPAVSPESDKCLHVDFETNKRAVDNTDFHDVLDKDKCGKEPINCNQNTGENDRAFDNRADQNSACNAAFENLEANKKVTKGMCNELERNDVEKITELNTPVNTTNEKTKQLLDVKLKEHKGSGSNLTEDSTTNHGNPFAMVETSKNFCEAETKLKVLEKRKQEIEQSFVKECSMFVKVVKLLVSKDPSLAERLEDSFSRCLTDMGRKCVDELELFVQLTAQ